MEAALITSVPGRLTFPLWPCHLWINTGQGCFLHHAKFLLTFLVWFCYNGNNCVPSASWSLWIFMWELPVSVPCQCEHRQLSPDWWVYSTLSFWTILFLHFFRTPCSVCASCFPGQMCPLPEELEYTHKHHRMDTGNGRRGLCLCKNTIGDRGMVTF